MNFKVTNSGSFRCTPMLLPPWVASRQCYIHPYEYCLMNRGSEQGVCTGEGCHRAWDMPTTCQKDPQSTTQGKWEWYHMGSGPNQDTRD